MTSRPKIELKFVNVDDIFVDNRYQRSLNTSRVEKLRKAYSSGAIKAVSLSRRPDGSLWVYDGQHTLELHKRMGYQQIPAVIVDGTQEKEAGWFTLMNGAGVSKATQRDIHKAGVTARHDVSLAVDELLKKHNVTVASGGSFIGTTSAIGSILAWSSKDHQRLTKVFDLIGEIWQTHDSAWCQIVMRGIWDIAADPIELKAVRAGLIRHKITPRRVLDTASGMQLATGVPGGGSGYAAKAIRTLARIKD